MMIIKLILLTSLFIISSTNALAGTPTYDKAVINAKGELIITTFTGQQITPPKLNGQVGFDKVIISADKETIGWLALYPNANTSYPIPLKLIIYRNDKIIRVFDGNGLPIWVWRFEADGKQVGYEQETVHGHLGVHFELRSIIDGELLDKYDGDPVPGAPTWVYELLNQSNDLL